LIDRNFLFDNENFEICYKANYNKEVLEKHESDILQIVNHIGKITKLKFEENK